MTSIVSDLQKNEILVILDFFCDFAVIIISMIIMDVVIIYVITG